jgi:ribosomal protein L11 methylase PrmA
MNLNLPVNLKDKIYQIKTNSKNDFLKIVSYFPLSDDEKQLIVNLIDDSKSFDGFASIFSDYISEEEWAKSKMQIIKRFQDELFDID